MSIIRVSDLRQQAYEELRERIIKGQFPPDTKFQEIAIAEQLGVSRTPVREALAMLVRDGLLVQARRGFRFPRRTPRDVVDIMEVRMRLEPYWVRRVVERLDIGERKKLAETIRSEITHHRDSDDYIGAHARIRDAIMQAGDNKVFAAAINQFEGLVHLMRMSTLKHQQWRDKSADKNLKLADAIEAGDPKTAEEIQLTLLEIVRDSFLTYLATLEDDK